VIKLGVPWVNVAINHCVVPGGRNFKNLTHLKRVTVKEKLKESQETKI